MFEGDDFVLLGLYELAYEFALFRDLSATRSVLLVSILEIFLGSFGCFSSLVLTTPFLFPCCSGLCRSSIDKTLVGPVDS